MLTLDSLIRAALPNFPVLEPLTRANVEQRSVAAARRQLAMASTQIRCAFAIMLATFCLYVLVTQGRWVTALPTWRQSHLLAQFTRKMPTIFSAMERLIRSASLLAYFEEAQVQEALGYRSLRSVRDLRRVERGRLF